MWTSCIKPDVDLFMKDTIQQLLDLAEPNLLVVNNLEFRIKVSTQLFLSDLPAKALFWKTINYNGYSACTSCTTEGNIFFQSHKFLLSTMLLNFVGVCNNRQVLYPYNKNKYQPRTHDNIIATGTAAVHRSYGRKKVGSIDGVKGLSPLLQIFEYPKQVILDYMHLCCLGHMFNLIQRWIPILSNEALRNINSRLFSQKFPHNMNVQFNYPLESASDWKAKHFRVFLLSIGLPCMVKHLPNIMASHFALYVLAIKLLHCPQSEDEIYLADKVINFYCKTSPEVYDKSIQLFSLHAHLHLPEQVLCHGGLCFTSAFCFESAIRHLKKKSHGTKDLGKQIADWININTAMDQTPRKLSTPVGINEINIRHPDFKQYLKNFLDVLYGLNQNNNDLVLFLRFKDIFTTYHSVIYDSSFNCISYLISYKTTNSSIKYGQIIIFL